MANTPISRRAFLKGPLLAAAGLAVVPRHVLGAEAQPPPSDTLLQAVVGTGGMGMGHVGMVVGDRTSKLVAVCDLDARHLANALKRAGDGCTGYSDFRGVLDRGDVDVVHVPTPPHWHALVSIAAAQAGCDVYCEKPMTRTIGEAAT